jgi:hypothetical protein
LGVRIGHWLTVDQAKMLLQRCPLGDVRGKRDRAILGLLIGCGAQTSNGHRKVFYKDRLLPPERVQSYVFAVLRPTSAAAWIASCSLTLGGEVNLNGLALIFVATMLPQPNAAVVHRQARKQHPEHKIRLRHYRKTTFGPRAVAGSAAGAGLKQLRRRGDYGHNFASGFGQNALKNTIQLGVGTLRHEDPRSTKPRRPHGVLPKLKDAARNTFTVGRFGHKKRSIAAGRISGAMGAGIATHAATAGAGVGTGGAALGADFAVNTAREFIPSRKKHRHGHRARIKKSR